VHVRLVLLEFEDDDPQEETRERIARSIEAKLFTLQAILKVWAAACKNIPCPLNSSSPLENFFLSYVLARAEERRSFLWKPSYIYIA